MRHEIAGYLWGDIANRLSRCYGAARVVTMVRDGGTSSDAQKVFADLHLALREAAQIVVNGGPAHPRRYAAIDTLEVGRFALLSPVVDAQILAGETDAPRRYVPFGAPMDAVADLLEPWCARSAKESLQVVRSPVFANQLFPLLVGFEAFTRVALFQEDPTAAKRHSLRPFDPRDLSTGGQVLESMLAMGMRTAIAKYAELADVSTEVLPMYGVRPEIEALVDVTEGGTFIPAMADESPTFNRIVNRVLRGCVPLCQTTVESRLAVGPHAELRTGFENDDDFRAFHHDRIRPQVNRYSLYSRRSGQMDIWPAFPLLDAVDPRTGLTIRALPLVQGRGCPAVGGRGLLRLGGSLARAFANTSTWGYAAARQMPNFDSLQPLRTATTSLMNSALASYATEAAR